MMGILKHPLFVSVVVALGFYVFFAHILYPPVPGSLLIRYMIFVVIGILLVVTFDDTSAKRVFAPLISLMGDPALKMARMVALVVVVLGVAGITYNGVKPSLESPVELRTVHPAPPSTLKVYGKKFNLLKLTNPLRDQTEAGSDEFKALVNQGSELYYKNCIYCHGDMLDGQGHFGAVFNPRPANFQDVGTIAQLQESYLFWRITTGGPGLPREGAPWLSAMPVWHEMLKEDEVWKIILFLYDYTDHVPRSWELAESDSETDDDKKAADKNAELDDEAVTALYMKRCAHCHGEEGEGDGPAAKYMYPLPRDFSLATFKFKTTHADDEFPTDEDFRSTIKEGLPGTSMPGWKTILSDAEIDALIYLIKDFGGWAEEDIQHKPIDMGTQVPSSPESIARGAEKFKKTCIQCHGKDGRGNITSGKKLKDDWRNRIWPRNLTRPSTWRSTFTVQDIFMRASGGIRGTPMPEHSTVMKPEEIWDVANYVMTLRQRSVPLAEGDTVVKGKRVDGPLPTEADDPAWDAAPAITFAMAPNIIKAPRLFFTLNDRVTVRALFNDTDVALQIKVDDRTYSVPGDPLELQYRIKDIEPTRDAIAVQFPAEIPATSEKPWFRHGDRKHAVNMWFWRAPSVEAGTEAETMVLDAKGPDEPPQPRGDAGGLDAKAAWKDGQWSMVMRRSLTTDNDSDLQFKVGRYIPVAFANWDGVVGDAGSRHSFSSWYWLLLEPEVNTALVYGAPLGNGLLAGLLFMFVARRQRKTFTDK